MGSTLSQNQVPVKNFLLFFWICKILKYKRRHDALDNTTIDNSHQTLTSIIVLQKGERSHPTLKD